MSVLWNGVPRTKVSISDGVRPVWCVAQIHTALIDASDSAGQP